MSFSYSDKVKNPPPYKPYSYNFTLYRLPHNAWKNKKDGKTLITNSDLSSERRGIWGEQALHLGRAECATQISFIE